MDMQFKNADEMVKYHQRKRSHEQDICIDWSLFEVTFNLLSFSIFNQKCHLAKIPEEHLKHCRTSMLTHVRQRSSMKPANVNLQSE